MRFVTSFHILAGKRQRRKKGDPVIPLDNSDADKDVPANAGLCFIVITDIICVRFCKVVVHVILLSPKKQRGE